ncbi:fatty acyl-CoA reductase protein [Dioscorea alata]|uniref:Fatty acyl-CoA reductase protein n=1 Tax=Dioscorea alata TaxID=55571 RepID=A0ACB7WL09_DIOAL|nr:fatty acyl-CoA reductase protein [Dioscorea alata]
MEVSEIVKYLEAKSILITGSTGFLAKLFVEKVLRVQPNVKKLFLLVRAGDAISARQRVENEIASMEVFKVLRKEYGESFSSYFWSKVYPLAGDVSLEHLGIKDDDLRETLWAEVDVIINSAATTNFNQRYDVALSINTTGVKNVLAFARRCERLKMLLHVSTAYVAKEKEGIILENPIKLDDFEIDTEIKLIEKSLKELKENKASNQIINSFMRELGMKRANKFGWPNVYSFTKAMGEVILGRMKDDVPLVILRPTIIISTHKEPFPGWIEGVRTMDKLFVCFGNGKLHFFPASRNAILDLIPADMVVNGMLATMVSHSHQNGMFIYHVGSSNRNIVKLRFVSELFYKYFLMNPCTNKDGKRIKLPKISLFPFMGIFYTYMAIRHKIPLQVLWLLAKLFCSRNMKAKYETLSAKCNYALLLAKAYQPYTSMQGRFDDTNLKKLSAKMNNKDKKVFDLDPSCIIWLQFLMEVHFPSVLKISN